MIKTKEKSVPREEESFRNWDRWFLFPDEWCTTNSANSGDIDLNQFMQSQSQTMQYQYVGKSEGNTNMTHLTKPISADSKPVLLDDFRKDWNILPKTSGWGENHHQVLLRHTQQNINQIENICLVSRGGIVTTNNYYPSKNNVLCIDLKFRCFDMDYITIGMRSSNLRLEDPNGHACGVVYKREGTVILEPHSNRIHIDDGKIELKNCDHMTKRFQRQLEHHVIIKDDGEEVVMDYMQNGNSIYKIQRYIGDNRSGNFGKVMINNSQANHQWMIITSLKLYCSSS